jgi:hypothetical protein
MPQVSSEVISGTGTLYIAPEATAIPTLTGNPDADFAGFDTPGYTEKGVEVDANSTEHEVRVDEESFPVDVLIDKETASINVVLAQSTLQNLYYAMTGATLVDANTVAFGGKVKPDIFRVAFVGPAATTNKTREILFFRCYAKSAIKLAYKRVGQVMYQCQFMALADSSQPVAQRAGIFKDF